MIRHGPNGKLRLLLMALRTDGKGRNYARYKTVGNCPSSWTGARPAPQTAVACALPTTSMDAVKQLRQIFPRRAARVSYQAAFNTSALVGHQRCRAAANSWNSVPASWRGRSEQEDVGGQAFDAIAEDNIIWNNPEDPGSGPQVWSTSFWQPVLQHIQPFYINFNPACLAANAPRKPTTLAADLAGLSALEFECASQHTHTHIHTFTAGLHAEQFSHSSRSGIST